jgi:hypothetical protein
MMNQGLRRNIARSVWPSFFPDPPEAKLKCRRERHIGDVAPRLEESRELRISGLIMDKAANAKLIRLDRII